MNLSFSVSHQQVRNSQKQNSSHQALNVLNWHFTMKNLQKNILKNSKVWIKSEQTQHD